MVDCKVCGYSNLGKAAGKNCSECGQPLETAEEKAKREKRNKRAKDNARERHALLVSCGLTRGKDSMGRTIYE